MQWYFFSQELLFLLMTSLGFVVEAGGRPPQTDYSAVANEAATQFMVPALEEFMQEFWNRRRYPPIDFRYSLGLKPFKYPTAVKHGEVYEVTDNANVNTVGSRKDLVLCTVKVEMMRTGQDSWGLQQVVGSAKCHFTREPPQLQNLPPYFPPPRPPTQRPQPSQRPNRPRPPQQHNGGPEEARPNYNGQQSSWPPPSRPPGFPEPYAFDGRQNSHKQRPPQQPPKHRKRRKIQRYLQQHLGLDNVKGNRWRA